MYQKVWSGGKPFFRDDSGNREWRRSAVRLKEKGYIQQWQKQILIVEDDGDVVGYIEHLLRSLGYGVCACRFVRRSSDAEGRKRRTQMWALIDMMLAGDMDGIAVA